MSKVAAVVVALTIGEGLVVLAWLTASTASVIVIVQVLVAAVLGAATLAARYFSMRARYLDEVAARAAEIERSRLAENMHDALGHELSLIAVQAGALQLALQLSSPDASHRSAEIREGAERATLALREIVSVLPDAHLPGTLEPIADSLDAIVSRARAAGLAVESHIEDLDDLEDLPRIVHDTLKRLVREALTNAGRHAPGSPVTVEILRRGDQVRVVIDNPVTGPVVRTVPVVDGTGLNGLRRRVTLLGGTMRTGRSADIFTVCATMPPHPVFATTLPAAQNLVSPTRRLITSVFVPMAAALVLLLGYYTWAVHDATTDLATMTRIYPGMDETSARALLPSRDAPVRLSQPAPLTRAEACRYYTDGNFPLGYASWRVCFANGVVLSISDLR